MNGQLWFQRAVSIWMAALLLTGCNLLQSSAAATQLAPTATPATPSETLLGKYLEDGTGGFSYRWLAYIIKPQEGAADQNLFVDLNGQRLGPYSNLSQRFEISADGAHIAFAAEKENKWYIVVDGQEKWEHEGLGWAWYAWTADLEGKVFVPQTKAAILQFAPNGDPLAYMVRRSDTDQAIFLNGEPGSTFQSIGVDLPFVDGKVMYWARTTAGEVYVLGDRAIGPYEEIWGSKLSSDRKHFVFAARKPEGFVLVVDGQEENAGGEIDAYEIGPAGEWAYAFASGASTKVNFNGRELPGEYDKVSSLTLSPDGKHLAFWGRRGQTWSVVTDGKNYPGFDGYFLFDCGGETYSILWDKESTNLAYFARDGNDTILALNGERHPMPEFPGVAIQTYLDEEGNIVGEVLMGGPSIHREAFVECLLLGDQAGCDPLSASLVNGAVAYTETGDQKSFMVIGSGKEGPYLAIESTVMTSANHEHYAYIVRTGKGQQVVLDGILMDWAYDAIYRPQFAGNDGFAHLGKKGNEVFSVFYPRS